MAVKRTMYQRKVDVDMLNAVKSVVDDVSSVSPSSEQRAIDRLHVTSLPPCWRTITKVSSLASIVSSSNMAATSLPFESLGSDCKPSIRRTVLYRVEEQNLSNELTQLFSLKTPVRQDWTSTVSWGRLL